MSAAAGTSSIRIFNHEPGSLKVFHVINFSAVQILGALGIDEDFHIARLVDLVIIALLIESEAVRKTTASAALHVNPEILPLVGSALIGEILNFLDRRIS